MRQTDMTASAALSRQKALRFIVLIGVVSLFADMTYEGARSITGPFLGVLGASATVVGIVSGGGELLGYALRLISGYLGDRTGRYWTVTIIGYVVNLLAVPLLALAGRWEVAVVLILLERTGRGIRTPARDAMLSHASSQTGLGWGFGLHEALDQTGAIIGPLIVSAVLYADGGYERGFAVLIVPALLSLAVLAAARSRYPRPRDFELSPPALETTGFSRTFWVYVVAVCCIAAGYADFPLIAFHYQKTGVVPPDGIPVLYAIAMAADAVAALALGRLFDRIGIWTMMLATVASTVSVPLAFLAGSAGAVAAMVLWGIGMAAQESVMRAAIATLSPSTRRGTAYGLLNAAYGVAWFAGSSLLGVLYDYNLAALVVVAVVLQAASLPLLWLVMRAWPAPRAAGKE